MTKFGRGLRGIGAVATLAAALGGCGSQAEPAEAGLTGEPAIFSEGTRLKAVYQEVEGAPPLFLNWYDTELGVDCSFKDIGLLDRLVCFPIDALAHEAHLFADDACQEPLAEVPASCSRARFVAHWPSFEEPCGTTVQLFELGAVVPKDPLYYTDSSHDCALDPVPPAHRSYEEFHRIGREIPIDTLVSGVYEHASGPGRIVPVTIVASDGSGQTADGAQWPFDQPSLAWDTARKELVSTVLAAGHWYPDAPYEMGAFADADCTVPAAIGPSCGSLQVAHESFERSTNTCGNSEPSQFFELGAKAAKPRTNYYQDGSCVLDAEGSESPATNPSLSVFTVGAKVATSAFALEEHVLTGTGQVQLVRHGTKDGAPTSLVGFFDTIHETPCSLMEASDGKERCLPAAATATGHFSDPACSQMILRPSTPPDDCSRAPSFVSISEVVSGAADGCASPRVRAHIYPVAAPYEGMLYTIDANGCAELFATDLLPQESFLAVGPEISPKKFARGRTVRPE